jgi:hypothetical protein
MTTPADAAEEIYGILELVKELTARKETLQTIISNAIDLGELDDCLMADDKGYQLGSIRCCPVCRTTFEYDAQTKRAIKELQEQAKVEGHAVAKTGISYRFTAIEAD